MSTSSVSVGKRGCAAAGCKASYLVLSNKSGTVLLCANAVNNDWHEAVINSAKFATLSVEGTGTINVKTYLVKTARAAIHFYTKSGDSSAVKNIGGSKKNPYVGTNR